MATTPKHGPADIVVGFFSTGENAHRAINALIDAGFLPSNIGAAFHTRRSTESSQPNIGGSLREALGTTVPQETARVNTSAGTAGVQATGSGAGTSFGGAGRPKPITGSDLSRTGLPSELKSTMPHDPGVAHDPGAVYSGSDFERTLGGHGVSESRASIASQRLVGGGAVVTIQGSERNVEAERILENHGGDVQLTTAANAENLTDGEGVFEVFGTIEKRHRGL